MKSPTWEPSAGALLAFVNSNTAMVMCDLFTFTTVDGTVFRFTSADRSITVNGNTFLAGPKIERSTVRTVVGIEVDNMTLDMHAEPSIMLGSLPMVQAVAQGVLYNGTAVVERLYMDTGYVQKGTLLLFSGQLGQVFTQRGHIHIEVLSHTQKLDVMIPTGVYQPSCRNTVYDLNCGANRNSFKVSTTATVASGATRQTFSANFASTIGNAAGYFDLGKVVFTSGANAGISRTVKRHTGTGTGQIEVITPWPYPIAIGDAFDAFAGCDHTKATCGSKFSNLVHFAGEPFIPVPATVT